MEAGAAGHTPPVIHHAPNKLVISRARDDRWSKPLSTAVLQHAVVATGASQAWPGTTWYLPSQAKTRRRRTAPHSKCPRPFDVASICDTLFRFVGLLPPHIATRQKGQRTGRPAVRGQPDSLRPNDAIFRLTAYRAVNDKPAPAHRLGRKPAPAPRSVVRLPSRHKRGFPPQARSRRCRECRTCNGSAGPNSELAIERSPLSIELMDAECFKVVRVQRLLWPRAAYLSTHPNTGVGSAGPQGFLSFAAPLAPLRIRISHRTFCLQRCAAPKSV